ncbi:MAG: ATP-binding protein [Cytophagales bacterium]
MGIIGRNIEKEFFKSLINSSESSFLVVYGRRRVGKTFLIREYFANTFAFSLTGIANVTTKQQLANFHVSLQKYNTHAINFEPAKDWFVAFQQLIDLLKANKEEKKIIFLDELPWLDTSKSFFINALEHFWNSWASARKDVILIGCGSAASWMINKLINNTGGLHNRVTHRLKIQPFTLSETEEYFNQKFSKWERYQLCEIYMATGGIPFYLNAFDVNKSISQNINKLYFEKEALLKNEFFNLYKSLFKNSEIHEKVVESLSSKTKGLLRTEILQLTGISDGGTLTKTLLELEESGFVRKYTPMGKLKKDSVFQLMDFYTLFYYQFIKNNKTTDENYWLNIQDSPKHRAWAGYAFELLCLSHLQQMKKYLGIAAVQTEAYTWRSKTAENGAQIDLVLDRRDMIINLFEMKFSINEYVIDKNYEMNLRNKLSTFKTETKTKKSVFLTMVSTYGLKDNNAARELIQNSLTMDALF